MTLQLDIQSASSEPVPDEDDIRRWITATLEADERQGDSEICVRLVDSSEMAKLNHDYRHRQGPTNVLSFPTELPAGIDLPLLGDIVICAPLVQTEAVEQHKLPEAHWAHLTIHGTLHLLGYDHVEEAEATVMESLESRIVQHLGYPCPYVEDARHRGELMEQRGA